MFSCKYVSTQMLIIGSNYKLIIHKREKKICVYELKMYSVCKQYKTLEFFFSRQIKFYLN